MNNDIFISYVIPCYNVEKYLPKCMESLANQRIKEGAGIEYIFVNDGSNDDTLTLLKEFVSNDSRAKLVDQKNQGVCAARNSGLKLAKGKYIYFHDGDDILTEEASQVVYDEYKISAPDIIIPKAYSAYEDELDKKYDWNTFGKNQSGHFSTRVFVKELNRLPISVKVYKRELLVNNKIFFDEDLRVGEVYTFFFHALAYSQNVTLSEGRLMIWVMRRGGTTIGYNIQRDREIINTMHRIDQYASIFDFDIISQESYQSSLYEIVSVFGFGKYKKERYSSEIGLFFKDLIKDKVLMATLNYYIRKRPLVKRRYLDSYIMLHFPVRWAFFLLKVTNIIFVYKQRMKKLINF